jgi:CheY-like chemotaxis protein
MSIKSALDLAANEEFDVLISDIGLPDGSGIDLMRTLHATRPLFGIALTGYGMEEDIRKSYDGGFGHHLVKPVDLNKLDMLIQQSLAKSAPNGQAAAAGCAPV